MNQGFAISKFENRLKNKDSEDNGQNIEVKDIHSDDETSPKRKYCHILYLIYIIPLKYAF